MKITVSEKSRREPLLLLLTGAAAGFLNGLLGAGGGIVLVFAFGLLNPDRSPDGVRDNFAATIACILPITALSAVFYARGGGLPPSTLSPLILPAVAGGVCGALLLDRINTVWLKKLFAVLVAYSGASMLLR